MHARAGVAIVAAVAVLALAGCNGQPTPQQKELLSAGRQAYLRGDDDTTIEKMSAFLDEASRTRRADEAWYFRGLAHYRQDRLQAARSDLEQALDRTSDQQLRAKASMALADIAYDTGSIDRAEMLYRQALENLHPSSPPTAHAHFRLGAVLQRQGRWRDADVQFSRVMHYFPDSKLAELARRRVNSNTWSVQTGAFSKFNNANDAKQRFASMAHPTRIETRMFDGELRYVVLVGRFATFDAAAAALGKIESIQSDAYIVAAK